MFTVRCSRNFWYVSNSFQFRLYALFKVESLSVCRIIHNVKIYWFFFFVISSYICAYCIILKLLWIDEPNLAGILKCNCWQYNRLKMVLYVLTWWIQVIWQSSKWMTIKGGSVKEDNSQLTNKETTQEFDSFLVIVLQLGTFFDLKLNSFIMES